MRGCDGGVSIQIACVYLNVYQILSGRRIIFLFEVDSDQVGIYSNEEVGACSTYKIRASQDDDYSGLPVPIRKTVALDWYIRVCCV